MQTVKERNWKMIKSTSFKGGKIKLIEVKLITFETQFWFIRIVSIIPSEAKQ